MEWKQLSKTEWAFVDNKLQRILVRIKEDTVWIICKPNGEATQNAFMELEEAKKYVEKYFSMYQKFVDFEKPIT